MLFGHLVAAVLTVYFLHFQILLHIGSVRMYKTDTKCLIYVAQWAGSLNFSLSYKDFLSFQILNSGVHHLLANNLNNK